MKTTNIEYISRSETNKRPQNEDSFIICQLTPNPNQNPLTLLAISDGIGGYEHGEDISREALKKISLSLFETLVFEPSINNQEKSTKPPTKETLTTAIKEAIAQTNAHIKRIIKNNSWYKSGATLAVALISGPRAIISNLGDSPIYHYSRQKIRQITDNHTLASALRRGGIITSEMAAHHEGKNMLELYLGCDNLPPDLPIHYVSLYGEDLLLLCSDGVSNNLKEKELKDILAEADLNTISEKLISQSRQAGETDNQTLIVWRYLGESADNETVIQSIKR